MSSSAIEIRDVGPVEHLTIDLPEGGGLVVVRGRNGCGKTHSLEAVSALVGGKGKPPSRDGSLGAQVEGLGARITITKRATRTGEVEVSALVDGDADPSLLVDPGIKSPEAADSARIKALLRLSGATVDASAFAGLVGGMERLEELCRPSSLDGRALDIPAMAAAIKRDLEAAARKPEQRRESAYAKATGIEAALKGLEGDARTDLRYHSADAAREAHTRAVREHQALQTKREGAASMLAQAQEAREALASFGEEGSPEAVASAEEQVQAAAADVDAARAALARAKAALRDAESAYDSAEGARARQARTAGQRERLQRAVDAAADVRDVPREDVDALARAIESAEREVAAWTVQSKIQKLRDEMDDYTQAGIEADHEAARLREAAAGTEAVVIDAVRSVCGDNMSIHDGRLYVRTDRGQELFTELSHGERWRMALDISVNAVGEHGLLVVRQEAYESLDPINRQEIHDHARSLGVHILTAEAADGEIRAEGHGHG